MAEILIIKCDECGKITEQFSDQEGWIEIGSPADTISVVVSGKPSNKYWTGDILHFCSSTCLSRWIHKRV